MAAGLSDFLAAPIREQVVPNNEEMVGDESFTSIDNEFDESQCLFCNQMNLNLDQNLAHMSKAHGLHLDLNHLLVDVSSLLAHFHLIISGYYECIYCGTQRNTRQGVQQHMMAKGHCKYDVEGKGSDLKDFYDLPAVYNRKEMRSNRLPMGFSGDTELPSMPRLRRARPSKRADKHSSSIMPPPEQTLPTSPQSHIDPESGSDDAGRISQPLGALSTRALKQEHTLNNLLSQLRADDRRSLVHLPVSEQRALLATHHKQMEKARRAEQIQRGNLESAGNRFNCLGKIRLIRKPPHTGNIHSLKR